MQGHATAQAPLEPYATPKSVLHCVLCAEEDAAAASALLDDVACCYQGCRLGSHATAPGRAVFTIPPCAASCAPCHQQPSQQPPSPPQPLEWPASTAQQQVPSASTQAAPAAQSQKTAASRLSEGTGRGCGRALPPAVRIMTAAVIKAATQLQQRLLHAPPCLRCCLHAARQLTPGRMAPLWPSTMWPGGAICCARCTCGRAVACPRRSPCALPFRHAKEVWLPDKFIPLAVARSHAQRAKTSRCSDNRMCVKRASILLTRLIKCSKRFLWQLWGWADEGERLCECDRPPGAPLRDPWEASLVVYVVCPSPHPLAPLAAQLACSAVLAPLSAPAAPPLDPQPLGDTSERSSTHFDSVLEISQPGLPGFADL